MTSPKTTKRLTTRIQTTFQDFFASSTAGGIVILTFTAIAMLWANGPWGDAYKAFLHAPLEVTVGSIHLHFTFEHFVNDALMVIFFLTVGIEIKRELLIGELSSLKKALLPMIGAIFGMIGPAAIFVAFNAGTPAIRGWGVPVATDIAFALGILALVGPRVPIGLKVFLAALAIVDDLLSVLVIAIFYSGDLNMTMLLWAVITTIVLYTGNRIGVRWLPFYGVLGVFLWFFVFNSGIHATIAGVVLALTIPVHSRIDRESFFNQARDLINDVLRRPERDGYGATQADAINALEELSEQVQAPSARIEHSLQPYVSFLIMPIFALANAGVVLSPGMVNGLLSPVSLGIALGLFVGKQVGVTFAAWLSVKLGWAELPDGTTLKQIYGVSLLCGIGFTMALFVAHLAFVSPTDLELSKLSILIGSSVSAIVGFVLLRRWLPTLPARQA
ncbi:MAG: Na+/H+ antiporter NhaA [Candidatus Kapabacteria bacterium]|jgi:NhaA family Na+:H+ antiporter|nr:Na+/H+ antiporter NhaA [Candidatus Kapabacteria bacterium]